MKTFAQIKREAKKGDYQRVSEIVGCSHANVEAVVNGDRPDNFHIRKVFHEILRHRSGLARRYNRLNS